MLNINEEGEMMTNELFIASIAFGLFIVCPRMAGMMHVISKHTSTSILKTVLMGTLLSIPLLFVMVLAFSYFNIWGAVVICVITDMIAALIMKEISMQAAIETFIIALFVVIGVKIAPMVSNLIMG